MGATKLSRRLESTVRAAFTGAALTLAVLSCGHEPAAPAAEDGNARRAAVVAWAAEFPAGYPQFQAAAGGSGGVEFSRVRIVLNNPDGSVAIDTVVNFPAGATELQLTLSVPLPTSAPATGQPLALSLAYQNAAGETVFRGGPVTVNAVPVTPGAGPPPPAPVTIPIAYTGPGASAVGVRIVPRTLTVNTGSPFSFSAQALDASGNVIPNTPIVFVSQNQVFASINAATGAGTAGGARGTVGIVAQLLTGPTDVATLTIVSPPASIAAVSGSGQTAAVNTTLPQPVVVRVTAADGLGASGVPVSFSAGSGGSAGATTVTTDASGNAQTTWKLGATPGPQTLTASAAGLAGSPVSFTATARSVDPVRLTIAVQPPASTPAGTALAPAVIVQALDAAGFVATTFSGPVTLTLGSGAPVGGMLSGTATVNAVAGIATFGDLRLNVAGTYAVVASAPSLIGATSNPFQIVPGAASRLAFQNYPIAGAAAGTTFDPVTVVARDQFNNSVPTFTGSVTLATDPASAAIVASMQASSHDVTSPPVPGPGPVATPVSLSGVTTVNAVAGTATFSAVSLQTAGTYSLVASSAGLSTAVGPSFRVSPGPASNVSLVSGGSQSGPGSTALANPIVVRTTDAFGNSVTGSTINFTPAAGSGSANPTSAVVGASGTAQTTWTLGAAAGAQTLNIAIAGVPGSALAVSATATAAGGGGTMLGYATEFPSASNHLANYLLGSVISVGTASTLSHLALIAKTAGPMVKMALYTDVAGNPGGLIASTGAMNVAVGVNEFSVTPTALAPGNYWIMAVFNVGASVGIDFANSDVVKYISFAFGNALPTTFPTPTVYTGQRFNYYIRVNGAAR